MIFLGTIIAGSPIGEIFPKDRSSWFNSSSDNRDEWVASISENVFNETLCPSPGLLTLWGRWSDVCSDRKESIVVHSALVSPERSLSLLRALQTTKNVYDYKIPDAGDNLEIDHAHYKLKGWIKILLNTVELMSLILGRVM